MTSSKQAMKKAPSKQAKRSQWRKTKRKAIKRAMTKKSALVKMSDCQHEIVKVMRRLSAWFRILSEGCQEVRASQQNDLAQSESSRLLKWLMKKSKMYYFEMCPCVSMCVDVF